MKQMSSAMIGLAVVGSMGWILMACLTAPGPESRESVGQSSQAIGEACLSDADCASGEYCDFSQSIDPSLGGMCNERPGCGICTSSPCWEVTNVTFSGPTTYCADCTCKYPGGSSTSQVCDEFETLLVTDCESTCL